MRSDYSDMGEKMSTSTCSVFNTIGAINNLNEYISIRNIS